MDAILANLRNPGNEPGEFASAMLEQTYRAHFIMLHKLQQRKLRPFHEMMHNICLIAT